MVAYEPGARSAAESSVPVKPPRIARGVEVSVTRLAGERATSVPAIQISDFDAFCAAQSIASSTLSKAFAQLEPSPSPAAPSRTWMTDAPPPWPTKAGKVPVTVAEA